MISMEIGKVCERREIRVGAVGLVKEWKVGEEELGKMRRAEGNWWEG